MKPLLSSIYLNTRKVCYINVLRIPMLMCLKLNYALLAFIISQLPSVNSKKRNVPKVTEPKVERHVYLHTLHYNYIITTHVESVPHHDVDISQPVPTHS
jgi:hypothetical protein